MNEKTASCTTVDLYISPAYLMTLHVSMDIHTGNFT